jgi:DNA recombination protein RmuC
MLPPVLADVVLLVLLALLIWLAIRQLRAPSDNTATTRLDVRLEEQTRRLALLEDRLGDLKLSQQDAAAQLRERLVSSFSELREELRSILSEHNTRFEQRHGESLKSLSESLQSGITNLQKQIGDYLNRYSEDLGKRMEGLTKKTDERLQQISGQVDKRLTEGFEKTTATFADILKRLALIDEAQKKITELSTNVVSLQEILADKRSRGAFGEVQLNALVSNVMPGQSYKLQYTLPNNNRADCVLFLPEPTGTIAIDSKFPLESYRLMTDVSLPESERKAAERLFRQDITKHIQDIASKYIVPGTTADAAMMFIPAEAVFAEIHAHYPDLVDKAHASRIYMVSPTTLWAILNTARSVLRDAATREQVHVIQEHLGLLGKDFGRFQKRMDELQKHIKLAHDDVENVNKSARKITARFEKIERVELQHDKDITVQALPVDDDDKIT